MDFSGNFTSFCYNCSYDTSTSTHLPSGVMGDNGSVLAATGPTGPDLDYAQFRDSSRFWVKRVFIPIIMCIGTLGNGLTIVILTRRRMRSSTNHYLTALAFFDMFYLFFAFTLALNNYPSMGTYLYYSYYRYALMLTDACSNTSVWLTVTFTIERYVAVCHPIRGKMLCTRSRAKKVIVTVACLCFLVVIPTPLEWRVVEEVGIDTNVTVVHLELSELGSNDTYKQVYYWFTSVTFIFLPLTLLAIFNSFLIRSVHQSKTQRRRMTMRGRRNDHTHQENRITIMLIAVVILFLLCQLPTAVILVYTSIYTPPPKSNEFAVILGIGNICNLLMAVNAASNFLLYCAFSDRYRRTFLRIFLPCMFHRASPTHSQATCVNTTCTQAESESLCGGSFRRGRSTKVGGRRGSPADVYIGLKEGKNGCVPVVNHRNGLNGAVKRGKQQQTHLQVPPYNGVYVRDERKDSDATNDTSLSTEELCTMVTTNPTTTTLSTNTAANGGSDSHNGILN